jgi:c-di-GMP-binding flagellar brake protein YcgR
VRSQILPTSEGESRYGLEFRELSMAQEDILHKAVLAMQREVLSDDDEDEDISGEPHGT